MKDVKSYQIERITNFKKKGSLKEEKPRQSFMK